MLHTKAAPLLFTTLALAALLSGCARTANIVTPVPAYILEVNTANRARIAGFAELGDDVASRVIEAREQRRFTGCGDLVFRVPAVGPFRVGKLSERGLRVNGETC